MTKTRAIEDVATAVHPRPDQERFMPYAPAIHVAGPADINRIGANGCRGTWCRRDNRLCHGVAGAPAQEPVPGEGVDKPQRRGRRAGGDRGVEGGAQVGRLGVEELEPVALVGPTQPGARPLRQLQVVLAVADASVLANAASGVIFVIGADQTTRNTAKAAVDRSFRRYHRVQHR